MLFRVAAFGVMERGRAADTHEDPVSPLTLHRLIHTHRGELHLLAGMLGLLSLLAVTVAFSGTISRFDLRTVQGLNDLSLPGLTTWVIAITDLGGTDAKLAIGLLATIAFATFRQWRAAVTVALSVAVTEALVAVLKHIAERPRPPAQDALTHAAGFSFPSGHAAASTALYALLAWLTARHVRGPVRVAVLLVGGVLVGAIGLSRVYLGAHYPTDVLAGWLVGGSLAVLSWLVACALWPVGPRAHMARDGLSS